MAQYAALVQVKEEEQAVKEEEEEEERARKKAAKRREVSAASLRELQLHKLRQFAIVFALSDLSPPTTRVSHPP